MDEYLRKNQLLCGFDFFYTPRRLVLWHREFPLSQPNSIVEQFGAPVKIAYKDGVATPAAVGFAKKCGVNIEDLEHKDTPKGPVLYFKQEVLGKESKVLLNEMINEFIASLNFGKSMRWGSRIETR